MPKKLIKGNEAIALSAISAGLDAYFGYPITPQNEVPEYLSKYMPEHGKVLFKQNQKSLQSTWFMVQQAQVNVS
jgi:2-oxoglutarate ferredoxin oxidoreductase subunit alpha